MIKEAALTVFLSKVRHPELFQGSLNRRNYFEGWYFKLTTADGQAIAVIPGVALGASADSPETHAFVQFIQGARTEYFRYPITAFSSDNASFRVCVAQNVFSREGVSLDLQNESISVRGNLRFTDAAPFPASPLSPGVMGPLSYVPFMECYHGIVSLRHNLAGTLEIAGEPVCFDGGVGYAEKDWGRSFPRAWVWLQANRFPGGEAFLLSVADIPCLGRYFRGFFAFLYADHQMHLFATYNGARVERLARTGGTVEAVVTGHGEQVEIHAHPGAAGLLKAPKSGRMDTLIEESNDGMISMRLTGKTGELLFEGESRCAGMECFRMEQLEKPKR